ncbi:MAG: response regulator transcription factor, partial [Candidatus Sericytochromatia bacterium]|nr:response regulator transcription factor [Candidatus Sericytochromatia bacterium]
LLRRQKWSNQHNQNDILEFGNAIIDFTSLKASVDGKEIKLTNLEFRLMRVFFDNQEKVLSREDLMEKVWEIKDYLNLRTVDNFILRLRKYFEPDPSFPKYFHSFRGVGYKFTKD